MGDRASVKSGRLSFFTLTTLPPNIWMLAAAVMQGRAAGIPC